MPLGITNLGIVGVALFVLFSMIGVLLVNTRTQERIIKSFTVAVDRFTVSTERWLTLLESLQEDGRARDIQLHNIRDQLSDIRQKQDLHTAGQNNLDALTRRILDQITSRKKDTHETPQIDSTRNAADTQSVSADQPDPGTGHA